MPENLSATTPAPTNHLEVLPRDLSAYRQGNTGIDYVHRFESGRPGPHVLINALTHGNEFCGMVAATQLLDTGVRPLMGTLTVSFANVEAYETFDPANPFESRQIVHNLNRVWSNEWLDGLEDSPELRRARVMRPVVAQADHLLDIHSTSQDVAPFWVSSAFARNSAAALAIGVVECGQHFLQASSDVAIDVARRFLAHFGLIAQDPVAPTPEAARRFELLQTYVIKTPDFAFTRPCVGFEVFAKDELIATDGPDEIRAPCDDCTILMPARVSVVGREGVYLSRPLA